MTSPIFPSLEMCYNSTLNDRVAEWTMEQDGITVKGTKDGLLIRIDQGPWEERLDQLAARLEAGATFFQGGRAALEIGGRELEQEGIQQVRDLLARAGVELWAIASTCDTTVLATVRAGLAPNLGWGDRVRERGERKREPPPAAGGLVVRRTLRSGQRLEHPGDVIIIGDVHAGAEVVAGRHVIVWGKLRGLVHAGAMGDESAVICALDLAPTQLRIAGHIARSPEERRRRPTPEMAQVRDGRIEAVTWHR